MMNVNALPCVYVEGSPKRRQPPLKKELSSLTERNQ
jgi:hypothetical protein